MGDGCQGDRTGRFCGEFWRGYTLKLHNRLNYSRLEYLLFVAAGVVSGYIVNMLAGSPEHNMPLLDRVLVWAKLVWLLYLPIAVFSGLGILLYNPREDFHLERRRQTGDYLVIFQVTTRGFNKEAVERGVRSVLYWAPRYLRNYEIRVVTEDDVDKGFFSGLKRLSDRVRVVYIPRGY